MDMKKILQAMDGVSTKPVEGASDMTKFLSIVNKNDVGIIKEELDNNTVLNEGADPHKVSLPVQMAMQHYQKPQEKKKPRVSVISKYFVEAEEAIAQEKADRRALINQYAGRIAERVRLKESGEAGWGRAGMAGVGLQTNETPIEPTDDPNNPLIHSHEKANPMQLKSRIVQARNQLRELADMAESNDLVVWEKITRLAKGGMFMGLEQNLEQIRHGIAELAAKRKKGGVQSRGIDKNIG